MTTLIDDKDKANIIKIYSGRVKELGVGLSSIDFGSPEKLDLRYSIHEQAMYPSNPSVLDIGCGPAGFIRYLKSHNIDASYTGYDMLEAYIIEGTRLFPDATCLKRISLRERDYFRMPHLKTEMFFAME